MRTVTGNKSNLCAARVAARATSAAAFNHWQFVAQTDRYACVYVYMIVHMYYIYVCMYMLMAWQHNAVTA